MSCLPFFLSITTITNVPEMRVFLRQMHKEPAQATHLFFPGEDAVYPSLENINAVYNSLEQALEAARL